MNDVTLCLVHHGIMGMHWGEKNGPPYPLVTRTHNLRNKEERSKLSETNFTKEQPKKIDKSPNFYDKVKSKVKNPYKTGKDTTTDNVKKPSEPTKSTKSTKSTEDNVNKKETKTSSTDNGKKIDKEKIKTAAKIVGAVAATAAITAGVAFIVSGKSGIMLRDLNEARVSDESVIGKKYMDYVIKKGDLIQTLSFDPNRIADPDNKYGGYIYSAVTDNDKTQYEALFNRLSLNKDVFKEKSKSLPQKLKEFTGAKLKFSLKATKDIKVASEMASSEAMEQMMKVDKGFAEFVTDTIINGKTDKGVPYIPDYKLKNYSGYAEAVEYAKQARQRLSSGKPLTSKQADSVYRLFNLALPMDDAKAKMYREKFFKSMKASGYGGILDTNDSLYGQYKSELPVIVFDMDSLVTDSVKQTRLKDIIKAQGKFAKNIAKQSKNIRTRL